MSRIGSPGSASCSGLSTVTGGSAGGALGRSLGKLSAHALATNMKIQPTIATTRHTSPSERAKEIASPIFSAMVMKLRSERDLLLGRERLIQCAPRQKDRHPHARQRVATQRCGVMSKDDQRNQNIFTEPVQPLGKRQRRSLRDGLEAIIGHDARDLSALRLRSRRDVTADQGNVGEF